MTRRRRNLETQLEETKKTVKRKHPNWFLIPLWLMVMVVCSYSLPFVNLDPAALSAGSTNALATPTPTLNPEFVGTVQSAESITRATVAAGAGELSVLQTTATANALSAIYTQTHVAIVVNEAYTTQTAVARSTNDSLQSTNAAVALDQTKAAGALILEETQSAATLQAHQTATQSAMEAVALMGTQSAIRAETNETIQRDRARSVTVPAMVFVGALAVLGAVLLGFRLFSEIIPAAVLRLRTIRRPDGTVLFVMDPKRKKTDIVDPDKSLAPVIEITQQSADLAALPPGPDGLAVQERVTARNQLPRVYGSIPANVRQLPGADALGAGSFDQMPALEILPPGLVQQLAGQIENDLIMDAEYKMKE